MNKGRGAIFGAIVGLGGLGEECIKSLIIPNIKLLGESISLELKKQNVKEKTVERIECEKCFDVVLVVINNLSVL